MTKRMNHIGSSLGDFLKEEGVLEETRAIALKDAVAFQVQQAHDDGHYAKVIIADKRKALFVRRPDK